MNLTPDPYKPPSCTFDSRSTFERIFEWLRLPFPVRVGEESPFRWIIDALIVLPLWIGGCSVAEFFRQAFPILEPIAYIVGLIIGWFPIGMWMHYCRVARFTGLKATLLMAVPLAIHSGSVGFRVQTLPLAFAILVLAFTCELLLGKTILGWLPSSSARQRREEKTKHEIID